MLRGNWICLQGEIMLSHEGTDMYNDPDSEEIYDVRPTCSRSGRVLTPMLTPAGTPSKMQKKTPSPSSGTPTAGNTGTVSYYVYFFEICSKNGNFFASCVFIAKKLILYSL
jgi:hypothetical protein